LQAPPLCWWPLGPASQLLLRLPNDPRVFLRANDTVNTTVESHAGCKLSVGKLAPSPTSRRACACRFRLAQHLIPSPLVQGAPLYRGRQGAGARQLPVTITPGPSAARNLRTLASLTAMESLEGANRPLLLCGPAGSGKTTTLRALAHATNRLSAGGGGGSGGGCGLLELHLDESVDAKSLLGSYVCGEKPGEFA
jgi:hypothetical protein